MFRNRKFKVLSNLILLAVFCTGQVAAAPNGNASVVNRNSSLLNSSIIVNDAPSLASPLRAGGDFLWAKNMGGAGSDYGTGIAVDSSGNIYATGSFQSTADFDPGTGTFDLTSAGNDDIFVSKLDGSGNLIWAKNMGGASGDYGNDIAVDSNGNVYMTGCFQGTADFDPAAGTSNLTSAGSADVFISKLDNTGSLVWAKNMGGTDYDCGNEIAVDSSGNVHVVGDFYGTVDFDPGVDIFNLTSTGLSDVFISKLNSNSDFIWAKRIGGADYDEGLGIAIDSSGNVYTTGDFALTVDFDPGAGISNLTSIGWGDIFVSKLNSGGNFVWAKNMGGADSNDAGFAITVDSSGSVYTTGLFYGVADFNPGAGTFNLTGVGSDDIFVSKLDSGGNFVWAKSMGGTSFDYGFGISVDSGGSVYTTGYFRLTVDFNPGTGTYNLISAGYQDIFVSKLDGSGNFLWAKRMGGIGSDYSQGIALDSSDNVYAVGSFQGTVDFDPGAGTFNLTTAGNSDIFVSKVVGSISPIVLIHDENGNAVNGAQVFKNGALAGTTAADGILVIPGLAVGDQLVARLKIYEAPSVKNNHQNWAYRTYITSMDIEKDTEPTGQEVQDPSITQTLIIKKSNTLIGFNIVASVEWDADAVYLNELKQGFQSASDYLYDASDGQMLFEQVIIYDNNQNMSSADYQIHANNNLVPHVDGIGGLKSNRYLPILFGRYRDRHSSDQGIYSDPDGYHALIHEFGHYGLYLYDSYYYYDGDNKKQYGTCTSSDVFNNQTPEVNATLMYWPFNASEFSMQNISPLWSIQCQNTNQWKKYNQSDWETIAELYQDASAPSRWEFKTPSVYGGVVVGPGVQPVSGWSIVDIGNDASTGVCASPPTYQIENIWGAPARSANLALRKSNRTIDQGITDAFGGITVFGASNGDWVVSNLNLWGIDLYIKSFQVNCASSDQIQSQATQPTVIVLEQAPFNLDIVTTPGVSANQAKIIVKASNLLNAAPETYLTQNSATAVPVPLSYDTILQAYTGTVFLDATLPPSGTIIAKATDTTNHAVEVTTQFALESVTASQVITVTSADGQAEIYLPAGSLSANGHVSIAAGLASSLPNNLILLSGPYTFQGDEGLSLVNNANLSLNYQDASGTLSQVNISTAQIYYWDGLSWQALASTLNQDHQMVAAVINTFGAYALMMVDPFPPSVASITRADPSPTSAASVNLTVAFSEYVTNVDVNDFTLVAKSISGAVVDSVNGSGNIYTVTVNKGSGSGALYLNLVDNDTIVDGAGNSLGGIGTGNGNFTKGQTYIFVVASPFPSADANDGWTLESSEFSNLASTKSASGTLRVGDDARNRQYRSFLYFDTASLPNNAVITKVLVQIKKAGRTGDDPFITHGNLVADMKKGFFGPSKLLELSDFNAAAAPIPTAGKFTALTDPAYLDWYQLTLSPSHFKYINLLGATQFRLRFTKDDNNDRNADFISFYAGDAATTDQPQLIIEYYVP